MTRDDAATHARERIAVAQSRGWDRITFRAEALRALGVEGAEAHADETVLRLLAPVEAALCR